MKENERFKVIKNTGSLKDIIEEVANSTLDAVQRIFSHDAVYDHIKEDLGEKMTEEEQLEKVVAALATLDALQIMIADEIGKIEKESGLSYKTIELLVHAPYAENFIKENIYIGDTKVIKVENEGRMN